MSARLILIAHAETSATRRGVFPSDEGLEARGREAAAKRAGTLPTHREALTSPAQAALETAAALGLAASVETALADVDVGGWTGRSVMDIGTEDPQAASNWIENPAFDGHGGESFATLIARVAAWLSARRDADGLTIAVTHAAVLRAAAIATLDAPPAAIWRIEAPPLAMLSLSSDGRRWTMRQLQTG